jgi:hypothetical protein
MNTSSVIRALWWAVEAALVACSLLVLGLSSAGEWQPLLLLAILAAIYLAGDRMSSVVRDGLLTPAHSAMVLAMCLLGPAPAVAFGLTAAIAKSALRRLPASQWLANLAALGSCGLVGGVIARAVVGSAGAPGHHAAVVGATFGLLVFAVSFLTIFVNFAVIAIDVRVEDESALVRQFRDAFLPLIPGHLTSGVLTALMAVAYTNLGTLVLLCGVLVLGVFHYLIGALLRSEERADQLEARSIHLANMQLGVLSMLMDALALRDAETSRHTTAVARYARALAEEIGCDEEEREVRPGRQARRLRPGRGRHPLPPRARRRWRLPGWADRRRDPAGLARDRDLFDLRHDDLAGNDGTAHERRGRSGRVAQHRRPPARRRAGRGLRDDGPARGSGPVGVLRRPRDRAGPGQPGAQNGHDALLDG